MLCIFIGSIENNGLFILIRLLLFNGLQVCLKRVKPAISIRIHSEFFRFVEEFVFRQHTVFDDDFHVVPFRFKIGTVLTEHLIKLICNLLRNV